jgi:hypothetical protein
MAPYMHYPVGMLKTTRPKLSLRTQTVRQLSTEALGQVGGGFIMKDTIIVKTSGRIITEDTVIVATGG